MPTWFKVGPLTVEIVGFYWTVGIFGTLAGLWYWRIRASDDRSRTSWCVFAFLATIAFTPTLIPGYSGISFDHVLPASLVLFLFILGFSSYWSIFAAAVIPLLLFFSLICLARPRSEKPPDPRDL